MRKTIINHELKPEIKKQIENINALEGAIEAMASRLRQRQVNMWETIKTEYPDISDHCKIDEVDGEIIIKDYLKTE